MSCFLLNILLVLIWIMAVGTFRLSQFVLGLALGFAVIALTDCLWGTSTYAPRLWRVLRFLAFSLRELLLSNLQIAYDIITPRLRAQPQIIAIPLEARTDTKVTLLANFLTLTRGTLALDVSVDQQTLYVHAMYARNRDDFLREAKEGLEARLLETLR